MDEKIYSRNNLRLSKLLEKFSSQNSLSKRKDPKKLKKRRRLAYMVIILIIAFSFAYFVLQAIEPVIEAQCKSMAKSIATKISNQEATNVMANYEYDDLLNINKDENGNVKMVGTNIITVNEIISDIPIRIQEEMEKSENNSFSIRLGSFLGSKILSGMGPNIKIHMEIAGDLDTDLKSEFVSAGINQTLHRIYLEIKCNVIILTPFETMEEQIVNQVLLAEGVIVGEVPSSYYNLEGMTPSDALEVVN